MRTNEVLPDATALRSASPLPQPGDWSDAAELRQLQDEQLEQTLSWAAESPFYRNRLPTSGDPRSKLAALPVTTKADLREQYPFGMLAVPQREVATYHESSGSAGTPTPSYYTEHDWVDLVDRFTRKWVPLGADDVFLVRTPYALMVTGHLAHASARSRGATVVPADNRSLATPCARVVRVLRDLGVTLTWSMAQETLIWAAAARRAGLDPQRDFPAQRALYVGGDALSDARRRRITEIWGVPVVEEYGSTETGSLAGACPEGHLHLWTDRAIFEVRNGRTGELAPTGTGQLVVTPLFRKAMPLLRYDLADDVTISDESCACGWPFPRVKVFGRSAFGIDVSGRSITQDQIDEAVFSLPMDAGVLFWRGRVEGDRLQIQVERGDTPYPGLADLLTELVMQRTNVRSAVDVVEPGFLVPEQVLTAQQDVVKPKPLAGPGEDWEKAIAYY